MVASDTATRKPSPARTLARLLAEFAGFAALLFITCFVMHGYLVAQLEGDECHSGGIAVDVLAHGVRFPLVVYPQTEYLNASLLGGLLAAVSFWLLGRNLLALKVVVLLFSAASAVAMLSLLRGCLAESGFTSRRLRWSATAALVVALALAPRPVLFLEPLEIFGHSSNAAVNTVLLALFVGRLRHRSALSAAAFWTGAGFAFYLLKGTLLVLPLLGAAEVVLGWRSRRQLAAAVGGFAFGALPELLVSIHRHGTGWAALASRVDQNLRRFPRAFVTDLQTLAEYRIELLAVWAVAIAVGVLVLVRSVRRGEWRAATLSGSITPSAGSPPVVLGLTLAVSVLHLMALAVMAQGGLVDAYQSYGYPTLVVLFAFLVAWVCANAGARWGDRIETWVGAAAVGLTLVLYRPGTVNWEWATVRALWHDRAGAACSWRLAEGFEREYDCGLAPAGRTREEHVIERCRSLEPDQVLNCIGGIARERQHNIGAAGDPPAGLSAAERRAYAFYAGVHQDGDLTPCKAFTSPELAADCTAAVQLSCMAFADHYARFIGGQGLGRPRCVPRQPPLAGYWTEWRNEILARPPGRRVSAAVIALAKGCTDILQACF
jgi:hypothetical protein